MGLIEQNFCLEPLKNNYPSETAGSLMITNIPVVPPDYTIKQVEELLLAKVKKFETINYIYSTFKNCKLAGVISIKDTLRQPKRATVAEVMTKNLIVAHPYTDQERVAYLALKNNIKAIPVIDKDGLFLGVVPSDKILKVAYDEASQDLMGLAGVSHFKCKNLDDTMKLRLPIILKHRLPWLLLGLLGGVFTAQIISLFEKTLEQNIILASFIPLIVYMGGATLAQSQAFFIRDLAINPKINIKKYFLKQSAIIFSIAVFTGISLFLIGLIFYSNVLIVEVLAIALFAAIISSIITGFMVPYFFSRFKLDPANASGPIATIIQDLMGVTLYFFIASLFL